MSIKKNDRSLEEAQQIFQAGLKLLQQGKSEEADVILLKAHQLNPNNIDVLNLLGIRFYQKQEYKTALHFLNCANTLSPASVLTLSNLGLVHNALLQFQDSLDCCEQAIKKNPSIPEAHNNRGNALKGLGRHEEALNAYKEAVRLRPNYAEALSNQGITLLEKNMPEEAIHLLNLSLEANPNLASSFNSLGNAFTLLENSKEAFLSFERALEIDPNYFDACINFGNSLKKFKQYKGAIKCYQHALKMNHQHAKIFYLLSEIYYEMGNYVLAKSYITKSISLDASDIEAIYSSIITQIPKLYKNQMEEVESRKLFSRQIESVEQNTPVEINPTKASRAITRHPFYLAYQDKNNEPLISRFGLLCTKQAQSIQDTLNTKTPEHYHSRKIKIGIISHYFCNHPVWHAITKGWVTQLNSNIFDVQLYNTNGNEDAETKLAKLTASDYINCGASITNAAQIIAKQGLDILLYPEVGMDATTKALACLRLAPIQIASWGHPETTGLTTIDFFLSADLFEPDEADLFYKEKLKKLPNLGSYFKNPDTQPYPPKLSELGIDCDSPILLCPGSPSKYTPKYDQVLTAIAKELGKCQFIFFDFDENLTVILKERIRLAFTEAQLDANEFIRFVPFLEKEQFFGLMNQAHLYLDTIGFSGFNTAMQAISCNLPIITIEGKFMRSRFASAILSLLGLNQFVCKSEKEYIDKAIELIKNKNLHKSYRSQIASLKGILFEDLQPIRSLESFLIERTSG